MRKASNPNYVKFTEAETVVTFAGDRGQLRRNDTGEFFYREMADGRFTCIGEDLERKLIDAGIRAGQQVGITRSTYNRAVIWKVRTIAPVTSIAPTPREATTKPKPAAHGLPERVYASPQPGRDGHAVTMAPPAPVFPECEPINTVVTAPRRDGQVVTTSPANLSIEPAPADGGLLGRCLCEALNACKVAQAHAAAIGTAMTFDSGDVERMAVSIFIERTRNGSAIERMPANQARSHYQNGAAKGLNGHASH